MYDTTLVKTFTPIIPAGTGPTCEQVEDALRDILVEMRENAYPVEVTEEELETFVKMLSQLVSDWIDGEYTIFEDYRLVIKHYQRGQLDEMPEFNGY